MGMSRMRVQEARAGFGFVLPAVTLLLLFGFVPLVFAGYVSLFDFPLVNPDARRFLGLQNFVRALQDEYVHKAFVNTLYYALWQMPMQTLLGLFLAILVAKPLRGIGIFRAGYYLPVVISMVVASVIWRVLLDQQSGLINSVLLWFGLPAQPFLNSPQQALPVLSVMLSWKWVGFSMLIFLGGLQAIPSDFYEAAQIDGANTLQRFWYVTLPLLKRPAVYVIVTNTINAFKLFTPIYIITRGGPQESTLTMIYYLFREGFRYGRLGYASAIADLFTIFLLILAVLQLRIMRSEPE
jgi:fructooligosaccharide transport system permease protein